MINTTRDLYTMGTLVRWIKFIGAALLILCSFSGWASSSCFLNKNTTYRFPDVDVTETVLNQPGHDIQLGGEMILETNPSELASDCSKAGSNGTNLNWYNRTAVAEVIGTYGDIPVLRTNVQGIGYSVGLRCIARDSDGCDAYQNQTLWVGSSAYWPTKSKWYPYDTSQTMYWRVVFRVFQMGNYEYNGDRLVSNNQDFNTLGAVMQIGYSSQPTANVNIGSVYINVHGTFPTCVTTTSQEGNSIDLGEYTAGELRNNVSPKKVPFHIVFSQCNNAVTITTKLTSNYVTSGTTLLGNKNGDLGAGVEISTSTDKVLLPNNTNSSYSDTNSSKPSSRTTTFYATLKDNGKGTITPGNFETGGTLTFTYE